MEENLSDEATTHFMSYNYTNVYTRTCTCTHVYTDFPLVFICVVFTTVNIVDHVMLMSV